MSEQRAGVPVSAVVAWGLVAAIVAGVAGAAIGASSFPREIRIPGPEITVTRTVSVPSASPVPETVTLRACMAAQGEQLSGWTYRPYERRTLRNLVEGLESGLDPAFVHEVIQDLDQGAIDRYEAAADRCFN